MKVLYTRVSSLEGQKTDRQRINEKDYDLVIEDKCSGSIPFFERDGGKKILKLIDSIESLSVHQIDRLGRDLRDIMNTIHFFNERLISIHFIQQNLSTLDSDHFDDSCPVCLDRDVRVIGSCGHATCWNCAKRWFQEEKKTCPYSRCKNWLPLLKLKQSSSFKPLKQFKIPKIINQPFTFSGTLYEYQNTAFNWMTSINKGILAFDMGLGKSLTFAQKIRVYYCGSV